MFSGIISHKVKVLEAKTGNKFVEITVEKPKKAVLKRGESICLNGICSTIVDLDKKSFCVHYMAETLSKTNVESLQKNDVLNYEESLRVGDKNSGHCVSGHVDCVGEIMSIEGEGSSKIFRVSLPKEFQKYVVYKGSITVNGVALTVSKKTKDGFEVSLIPYTLKETNLDNLKEGDKVNIETDIMAKYAFQAKKTKCK